MWNYKVYICNLIKVENSDKSEKKMDDIQLKMKKVTNWTNEQTEALDQPHWSISV